MKFSYAMLPDYPLSESLASIKKADELGFYAVYAADETWHKDLWLLFAAAAGQTTNIRLGPSISGVVLREPTLIAQAAATLDELTNGHAEVAISSGNFGLLAQYHIDWAKTKPLSRVKEAVQVIRTLLDDGVVTFDGEFFNYSGLFTFARPVQERLPVMMGAMRGPKSFEASAEFSDGCHHALSYTREAYDYMIEHCTIGAERAGKNVQDLDLGAWIVFSIAEDGAVAKDAARSIVGLYPPRCPTNSSSVTASTRRNSPRSSRRSAPATWPRASSSPAPSSPNASPSPAPPRSASRSCRPRSPTPASTT